MSTNQTLTQEEVAFRKGYAQTRKVIKHLANKIRTAKKLMPMVHSKLPEKYRIKDSEKQWKLQHKLNGLRFQARMLHIARMTAKGRAYETVESPKKPLNKYEWEAIYRFQEKYFERRFEVTAA